MKFCSVPFRKSGFWGEADAPNFAPEGAKPQLFPLSASRSSGFMISLTYRESVFSVSFILQRAGLLKLLREQLVADNAQNNR